MMAKNKKDDGVQNSKLVKQRGAALIVALFVTSLAAVAAIAMIERLRINLRSTELMANYVQANLLTQGSLAWAMEQLNTDWRQKTPNRPVDATPIKSPVNRVNNAFVSGVIFDAQGRFNINNLSDPTSREDFTRLMTTVYPAIGVAEAHNITLAIVHWISAGVLNNMLDNYYAKLTPPYRVSHRLMASVSELRLVKGVTAELYAALSPYIIALPELTPININNAAIPVLMSLSPALTLDAAKTVAAKAKQTPFLTVQSFQQFDVVRNHPIPENKITVSSHYFLVKSSVKVNQQKVILYTLLQRILKEQKPFEVVIWQTKGTL